MLKFRPHHFMCTLGFRGHGYSKGFVRNYQEIAQALANDQDTLIAVVNHDDAICAPCPNLGENGICATQAKIDVLDSAHAEVLELEAGQVFSWKQAKERIREKMTVEKFHKACAPCKWKAYGVCEEALKELLAGDGNAVGE